MTSAAFPGAKTLAWRAAGGVVAVARAVAAMLGRTRRVDALIYKVDRLGDWLFAEAAIARILAFERSRGRSVVVLASHESAPVRQIRGVACEVETVRFEPRGVMARIRRTLAMFRLVAIYHPETVYCLRHGPDPVRDFVLRTLPARDVHAMSWVIRSDAADGIPHEIQRHAWLLTGIGIVVGSARDLLPRLECRWHPVGHRIVLAPFSSAAVKDWPDHAWAAVVGALSNRPSHWEIWVGPDQKRRAEILRLLIRQTSPQSVVTVHSGSLSDLVGAVASAELVISVDTLAAHLAGAVDAPLIALLGGGQYGDFAPWANSSRQRWLSHLLPCFGCNWQCSRPANECLQLITPERVVAEAHRLLNHLRERSAEDTAEPLPSHA